MKIPLYQVDAFASAPFKGNSAAVCPLEDWLPDEMLQAIAMENNLSETAYLVAAEDGADHDYHLRWFTPGCEVEFCGHATLASGHVVLSMLRPELDKVTFNCRAGLVSVARNNEGSEEGMLNMDAPNKSGTPADAPEGLIEAIGAAPDEILYEEVENFLLVYKDAAAVRALKPDFKALNALGHYGFIATAPGDEIDQCDFVSRYFVPAFGIDEDPVTGSAHCTSAPYWADRLGKTKMFARQISARGGELWLSVTPERVKISGHCVPIIEGVLTI